MRRLSVFGKVVAVFVPVIILVLLAYGLHRVDRAQREKAKVQPAQEQETDYILNLGGGWHAARERADMDLLKKWEAGQREYGLTCRFMGSATTDVTGRLGGRISPPDRENLYLCRERAIPAQDCTVE